MSTLFNLPAFHLITVCESSTPRLLKSVPWTSDLLFQSYREKLEVGRGLS